MTPPRIPGDAFPELHAAQHPRRLERLYAVVMMEEGQEGMVRRLTPYGDQPLITSDRRVAEKLLRVARRYYPSAGIVVFRRE